MTSTSKTHIVHTAGPLAWGLALLWGAGPVSAAAPDAGSSGDVAVKGASTSVRASLDQSLEAPESPKVGTPIGLRLRVEHPSKSKVRFNPALGETRWELIDTKRGTSSSEARRTTTFDLTFQIFRVGEATLPPLEVVVERADGTERTLKTEPVTVTVGSVLKNDEPVPTFYGARPPVSIQTEDYTIAWVGGSLLGVALALLAVVGWRRRSRDDASEAELERPADVVALEKLEAIEEAGYLEHGDVMTLYVRTSEAIRAYLGRRFGFPGLEWTTAEILERLERVDWEGELDYDDVEAWFRHVDLVKFSGLVPSTDRAERMFERAHELVEQTRDGLDDPDDSEGDGGDDDVSRSPDPGGETAGGNDEESTDEALADKTTPERAEASASEDGSEDVDGGTDVDDETETAPSESDATEDETTTSGDVEPERSETNEAADADPELDVKHGEAASPKADETADPDLERGEPADTGGEATSESTEGLDVEPEAVTEDGEGTTAQDGTEPGQSELEESSSAFDESVEFGGSPDPDDESDEPEESSSAFDEASTDVVGFEVPSPGDVSDETDEADAMVASTEPTDGASDEGFAPDDGAAERPDDERGADDGGDDAGVDVTSSPSAAEPVDGDDTSGEPSDWTPDGDTDSERAIEQSRDDDSASNETAEEPSEPDDAPEPNDDASATEGDEPTSTADSRWAPPTSGGDDDASMETSDDDREERS